MTVLLLLMMFAIGFPLLAVLAVAWLVRLLAQTAVPQDVLGTGNTPKSQSLLGRLRAWLMATPRRIEYRRDRKGRFRRVRRG